MVGTVRYSHAAMEDARRNFEVVATRLEATIAARNEAVAAAMADYEASGVAAEYAAKEQRWQRNANGVLDVVRQLRAAMGTADVTAGEASDRLRAIGGAL